ncbi:hypothetical protein KR018_004304 [Drosophila ironensis]|nr:hypothetical protein KR018_004304 [Drosophila ironensis]
MLLPGKVKSKLFASASSWHVFARNFKVTVVGAGGGIGQPLSLLIRQNAGVRELALHDTNDVKGVATDLSHIPVLGHVTCYAGDSGLEPALSGASVVVVAAGVPRRPGMEREQLMAANGGVAVKVASAVSAICPAALLAFITNPINSVVPAAAEVFKANGVYDPRRLFGITTLDVIRARKFLSTAMGVDPRKVTVPVIGGHAGTTILPLISQCQPVFNGELVQVQQLTQRIQEAGTEVVNAKAGRGSATLSMALAGAQFVDSLLRGLSGQENVVEYSFVASELTDVPFFASAVELGRDGIKRYLELPPMSKSERLALAKLLPVLRHNVEEGTDFARKSLQDMETVKPVSVPLPI